MAEPISPSNASATCTTSFAASTSPEQLTAAFAPAAGSTVAGSSSAVAFVTVTQDTTSTSLDASSRVNVRASTTYTATVTPPVARPGPVGPAGSVEFFDNGRPIAACLSQPLIGGGATCTVSYKSVGKHSITARYGGDANFTGSGSSARVVKVVPAHARGTITATMQWSFFYTPSLYEGARVGRQRRFARRDCTGQMPWPRLSVCQALQESYPYQAVRLEGEAEMLHSREDRSHTLAQEPPAARRRADSTSTSSGPAGSASTTCSQSVRATGRESRFPVWPRAALVPSAAERRLGVSAAQHRRRRRPGTGDRVESSPTGRVAQWESARFTRERSLVRAQPCPSSKALEIRGLRVV